LSSTAGSDINLGSFGFWSNNETMLGIHGYRTSAGNSWNTTAVGLSMDVDNTPRAGASLWLNANGNVGIGTTAPITPLHVQGTAQSSIVGTFASNNGNTAQIQSAGIALGVGGSTPWGQIWGTQSFAGTYQHGGLSFWTRNNEVMYQRMTIDYQGNVGIGTTAPCTASNAPANCKLSVAGAIQAKEVVVNTGWSDYVFAPSYRLKPLSEVATFIRANHHLPGIPSEAEVKENGVSLGEMQAKLLAKIEELTLHAIRLEQENRDLQARVARIEGRTPASAPASQGHN
jgi:hypothetical protein